MLFSIKDLEKMGVDIIYKDRIKNSLLSETYSAEVICSSFICEGVVKKSKIGGSKLCCLKGEQKEIERNGHALEDMYEQSILEDRNGIRTVFFRRTAIKTILLCINAICLFQIGYNTYQNIFSDPSLNHIIIITICIVAMIISNWQARRYIIRN